METWRKSSHSGTDGGECVEVADANALVRVRDTTNRDGGTLAFGVAAWSTFLGAVKRG
jgi:hypothetical protein